MKSKYVIIGLSLLLLSAVLFIGMCEKKRQQSVVNLMNLQDAYKEVIVAQYKGWQLAADSLKNISMENLDKEKSMLHSLLQGYKMIFYYTNKMCMPCVEKEINTFLPHTDGIGQDNILIIGQTPLFDIVDIPGMSAHIWSCKQPIFGNHSPEETPIMLFVKDSEILAVCYTSKMTSHSSQYFFHYVEEFLAKTEMINDENNYMYEDYE